MQSRNSKPITLIFRYFKQAITHLANVNLTLGITSTKEFKFSYSLKVDEGKKIEFLALDKINAYKHQIIFLFFTYGFLFDRTEVKIVMWEKTRNPKLRRY